MIPSQNGNWTVRMDHGMTIVETMVAVVVVGIFMAGVFSLTVQSIKAVDLASSHYVAATLCKNRLEAARTFDFDGLSTLSESATTCDASGGTSPEGKFKRATVVSPVYNGNTNLTEITVTVGITDATGSFSNQTETVRSLYTKY